MKYNDIYNKFASLLLGIDNSLQLSGNFVYQLIIAMKKNSNTFKQLIEDIKYLFSFLSLII